MTPLGYQVSHPVLVHRPEFNGYHPYVNFWMNRVLSDDFSGFMIWNMK